MRKGYQMNKIKLTDKEIYLIIESKCPGTNCRKCYLSLLCNEYVRRKLRYAVKFDEMGNYIEKIK